MEKISYGNVIAEWDEDGTYWEYEQGVPYEVLHPDITPEQALQVFVELEEE